MFADYFKQRRNILYDKVVFPLEDLLQGTKWMGDFTKIAPLDMSSKVTATQETTTAPEDSEERKVLKPKKKRTKSEKRASEWLLRLKSLNRELAQVAPTVGLKDPSRRVRIAVLDTGYDDNAPFFFLSDVEGRLKGWKDWVDGSDQPKDLHGHGTHFVSLVLKCAPEADIYVARIAESPNQLLDSSENVAKAISWASRNWEADIISMSFGFADEQACISDAIREAIYERKDSILFFAAASNYGANDREMFPARHDSVISIRGTDANGDFEDFNPPKSQDEVAVFGTLGLDVPSAWANSDHDEYKSGTSTATAIAAGIAGSPGIYQFSPSREAILQCQIPSMDTSRNACSLPGLIIQHAQDRIFIPDGMGRDRNIGGRPEAHCRLQKADQRFEAAEHEELEGHLVGMLLTQLKCCPQEQDPSKLNEVQLRLVRCNLKRRNRFLYAQQHSRGLDAGPIRHKNRTAAPKEVELTREEIAKGKADSKPLNDGSKQANSTIVTGTSASKLSDDFNLPQPDHAAPTASSIISTTAIDLDYPRPPRFKDDTHLFRCPCCCEALPVEMANKNSWRKHIADDLSPYTCIAADCDQPHVLFNTKEAWRQHVRKDHSSLTYWICFACGDGSQFNDNSAFVQHTKSNHAATISPDQIPVLCDLSKKTTPAGLERCPLRRGVMVEKDMLLSHIAKEIHSFSLQSLPWADDNGQESDERIHDSSEKVYEWLIQNEIPGNSDKERPSREERVWHSQHFQQNPYFASSSKASSSSEPGSNGSRGNELEELRREGESIVHESSEAAGLPSQIRYTEVDTRPVPHSTMFHPEDYTYALGRIWRHNVVISAPPEGEYGSFSAARVATKMLQTYRNIRICLIVGSGSGAPSQKHDIRLGDIVVGIQPNDPIAVLQYDLGKTVKGQPFEPIGFLDQPPILRRAVYGLQAQYERGGQKLDDAVNKIIEREPRLRKKCQRPDLASDRLYQSHIVHVMDSELPCAVLCGDDPSCLVSRSPRTEYDDNPAIHYGLIASANQLMEDASIRDELAQKDILCFEMEAAGMMNHFPCLVIRGISDYADSHKNKDWQWYAAMVSAAYAKDILRRIVPRQVVHEAKSIDILTKRAHLGLVLTKMVQFNE
ncbi:hypothetical protein N7501_002392 [Penicillium viridicatum]|nr:hypothetical protein N7501_002392 [Penicillium viridicatum]